MCDEYGGHGFVEGGAIHVDGGAHGQHEADDAAVDVVVLQQALEGDRQRGGAGGGGGRGRGQRSVVRGGMFDPHNLTSLRFSIPLTALSATGNQPTLI